MLQCQRKYASVVEYAFPAIILLAIMLITPSLAFAQGQSPWPSQNINTGRNSSYPPYNYVGGPEQHPQRNPNVPLAYPGSIYPGLPVSSYTYVQPTPSGGYVIGSYGGASCGNASTPTVYSAGTGYVVVDEGAVQDILPVNSNGGYAGSYLPTGAPTYQNNEYNYTVNNYYSAAPSQAPATIAAPSAPTVLAPPAAQPDATSTVEGYDLALGDIQQAWSTGDFGLMQKYLPTATDKIKLTVGGEGPFAMTTSQFTQLTQSQIAKLTTYSFVITSVQKQADGSVIGYITHTYSPVGETDGKRDTNYLAYTLKSISGGWIITEIDSSPSPLTTQTKGGTVSSAAAAVPTAT